MNAFLRMIFRNAKPKMPVEIFFRRTHFGRPETDFSSGPCFFTNPNLFLRTRFNDPCFKCGTPLTGQIFLNGSHEKIGLDRDIYK